MAAPLGRHGTLLLRSSVAEAPLLSAAAPAVCDASAVVGGARPTSPAEPRTEPRLSLPPSSRPLREEEQERKMVIKARQAEEKTHNMTAHACYFINTLP